MTVSTSRDLLSAKSLGDKDGLTSYSFSSPRKAICNDTRGQYVMVNVSSSHEAHSYLARPSDGLVDLHKKSSR